VWSVAGLAMLVLALVCSTCGRKVEEAAVRGPRVVVSVVQACPIGKAMYSTLPRYFLRTAIRGGGVFFGLLHELDFATEVSAKAYLDDNYGAVFLVEGGRV